MHSHMFIALYVSVGKRQIIDIRMQRFISTFLLKTGKNMWIFLSLNIWKIAEICGSLQDIPSIPNNHTNGKSVLNQRQIILSDE